MNLLQINNLAITYHDKYLFENLDLSVNSGERLVIIGESGSGKSSILKAILDATNYSGEIALKSQISYMPQDLALVNHKTVKQNVELPATLNSSLTKPHLEQYDHFGLANHLNDYVSNLSGGERQRVALMRALSSGGQLLLFDEPLSKLDQINKHKLLGYFLKHITDDYGLIYITHDLDEAVTLATKILVLGKNHLLIENNIQPQAMRDKLSKMLADTF